MARFFPLIAAALALFSSLVLASPATELYALGQHTNGQYAVIDLNDDFETTSTSADSHALDKRVNVRWCIESAANLGACTGVVSFAGTIALGIAAQVKTSSDQHDCKVHTGQLSGVHWRVYAEGKGCDTTAQLSTIATSIADYLREVDDNVCGVHCIRLDHAGNWNGYVTLGPAHQVLDHLYCGPKYPFGKCGGRKK